MGLYDYRPYVTKITNDRQIMFDCDKEIAIIKFKQFFHRFYICKTYLQYIYLILYNI